MKKILSLFVISILLLLSCDDKNDIQIPKTTINGNEFVIDSIFAHKILSSYLITLKNDTETLLISTTDTLEGEYKIINTPITFENDSIHILDNFLEQKNEDSSIPKMIALGAYLKNKNAYISKKGSSITITKDEKYAISGEFNISLVNVNNATDVVELNNGFFNNITPLVYKDPNEISTEEFYKKKEDIEAALQTVYNSSISTEQQQVLVDVLYTNQIEDRVFGSFADIKNHTLTPKNQTLSRLWLNYYTTIFRANIVLENAHKVYPNDIDALNIILSQAYILRAYTYTSLVNLFGEVPLILKTSTGIPETFPSFNSIPEIETQIIADLEFAINHLPNQWNDNEFKVNKDFSKVLLARIYFRQKNYSHVLETLNSISITNLEDEIYSLNINAELHNPTFKKFINKEILIFSKYSEVLLMLAEANNQVNNTQAAINYINQLKIQSDDVLIKTITKAELTEIIYNQWIEEFPLDGNRFYVLKKFNKAISTLDIEPYQLILPIPESEISVNVNAKQNPGY